MDVEYLVVGAGISGLSFANWLREEAASLKRKPPELLVIEADSEPGGYCKTIHQDGFVWDYSGHFFHFKNPDIERWLRVRMPDQQILTVEKRSFIRFDGLDIDFPFQKNIHQLPRASFIDCLVDLHFRPQGEGPPESFKAMLIQRFGRSIAEKFLIPYNEKLYAIDLDRLDADAMGRFFPHADVDEIIRNMRQSDNRSYNSTFTYPTGGAIEYVRALLRDLPNDVVSYGERLEQIDLARQTAQTNRRTIRFKRLISSAPLNRLVESCGIPFDQKRFTWNKVLVFNLGFDRKGATEPHWMYFPERDYAFYRVGWYDNIMGSDRMSLYVELGAANDAEFDVESQRARVMDDLRRAGIVDGHQLVSWHSVVLNPAYVHVSREAQEEHARLVPILNAAGVYPVGRYGSWTYCSIEDNMLQTRALARAFAPSLS
ncbi:MAG: FAD-dependent oxidoreductase [Myxococcota bacterium]